MRWPFRRAARGRHALGAAVTSIPVGPPSAVPAVPRQHVPTGSPSGPRVELGFADGTSRSLDADDPVLDALTDLARELRRTR